MATVDRQHYALQTIFSFFLGLMVVAFIGVGVNTFYPSPGDAFQKQLQPLFDRQSTINAAGKTPTPAEQAQLTEIQRQINAIQEKQRAAEQAWTLNTSIVLVLFATLVGSVSLVRSDQLRVLSNGLLLGGLFTMLYGMGWTVASGISTARFLVVLFALGVTIALGYLKFVRLRQGGLPAPLTPAADAASSDVTSLEERVSDLEARTAAAAAALSRESG